MPLTIQPFAENRELDKLRDRLRMNIAFPERVASIAGGVALIGYGLFRRSVGGLLLGLVGGALIHRGSTGHCAVYERLGLDGRGGADQSGVPGNKGIKVVKEVMVARSPDELYRYWRNLENLPNFMPHLDAVQVIDERRSHWVAKGPAGATVEWDAEIIGDRRGEFISWQSLPGSEVQNAGSVWFERAEDDGGTLVRVSLQYQPPGGMVGAAVAKMFGEAPDQQLDHDLARFKELVEAVRVEG